MSDGLRPQKGEGSNDGSGGLDRDRGDEGGAGARLSRREQGGDRGGGEQHRQAVVVGAADDVDQDERVEGDEGGSGERGDAALPAAAFVALNPLVLILS